MEVIHIFSSRTFVQNIATHKMEDSELCDETLQLGSSKFAYCRESSHPNYECYFNERQESKEKIMDKTISSNTNSSASIEFSGHKKWKKRLVEVWHSPQKVNVSEKETRKSEESDCIDVVSDIPSKSETNFSKPSVLKCNNQTEHIELLTAPKQIGEYAKPFKFEGSSKGLYSQKYLSSHERDPVCSNLNLASCSDDFTSDLPTKMPNVQYLDVAHSFESPIKMNPKVREISVEDIIPECKSFALYVELCQIKSAGPPYQCFCLKSFAHLENFERHVYYCWGHALKCNCIRCIHGKFIG